MEIRDFLHERLKEDEATAKALAGATVITDRKPDFYGCGGPAAEGYWQHFQPHRVLAEVKAKRAILDRHLPERAGYFDPKAKTGVSFTMCEVDGNGGTTDDAWPCDELKHLAAPYADHSDYDASWRLES